MVNPERPRRRVFDRKVLVDNDLGERLTELVRQNIPQVFVYEGDDGMLHIA